MFPPSQGLRLDIAAISQIFGSISIACWIVVFSPQIIENWRRNSADGLSVVFIILWLIGDFFNIFGAVLQDVLPTMIILAVYYTLADLVLLLQCFWYKGFTLHDEYKNPEADHAVDSVSERCSLLSTQRGERPTSAGSKKPSDDQPPSTVADTDRPPSSPSRSSFRERFLSIDGTHFSPAVPLVDDHSKPDTDTSSCLPRPRSGLKSALLNVGMISLVIASGVFGWWLSAIRSLSLDNHPSDSLSEIHFNPWGQVFGYICALLYLGSRVPQLLLNYHRKSTEGISMLFFLFACLGNLTYVLSIMIYEPHCNGSCEPGEAMRMYGRYVAVNFSWLLGSFGTLLLDVGVFVQYFMYRAEDDADAHE